MLLESAQIPIKGRAYVARQIQVFHVECGKSCSKLFNYYFFFFLVRWLCSSSFCLLHYISCIYFVSLLQCLVSKYHIGSFLILQALLIECNWSIYSTIYFHLPYRKCIEFLCNSAAAFGTDFCCIFDKRKRYL